MVRSKINLFQFIQKYNRVIGIESSESNEICFAFNWKNLIFLVCEAQFIVALTAFISIEANSMLEYGITLFAITSSIFGVILHLNHSWEMINFSKLIKNGEKFIEKRK